ncbi:gamma-glutamyltranspeptidase [Peptoniphilus stercorisuis]|uniref:Gamma-glutamyltranspeptidase n=1 Tax=Peptoniphilus stercorisuis TaxID=1436965 RepID=A0ABS4KCL8_9FIRM|nr:gamma-glutamyltranspeptidase [Peptoniphilus stercorisuis]
MTYSIDYLLSEEYAYKRANLIKDNAILPTISKPQSGGTVYLATADKWGNMVSYIQSNYTQFGSGIVIPNTGISLHNRGCNFSLNEKSDNYIMPNKRPYHTIIPGFLMHNDKAVGPFGVMGAFMQPQGHLQVLLSTIIEGLNPQDALNKPRWQWVGDKIIEFEDSYDKDIINRLNDIGHNTIIKKDSSTFGRGQIIWKNDANIYCGGCDPRTDSNIAIW